MKKVGIIRCQQTEDLCPGTTDFKVAATGKSAFQEIGESEVIGFVSCGGCPGKKAISRAKTLIQRGAEVIALASCITKGNPIGYPCPHAQAIKEAITKTIDKDIIILDYTH
jgi:predicted metal-binding protein